MATLVLTWPVTPTRSSLRRRGMPAILLMTFLLAVVPSVAHAADRVYWANFGATSDLQGISFANLDGSGGGNLAVGDAAVDSPNGMAIDSTRGRIYWTNYDINGISYANLDGSGGGDLTISGASPSAPVGLAVDPAAGRIYWANYGNDTISYANLDGSGAGNLDTGSATVSAPFAVALDPAAGRLYWANWLANTISYASLDGSGAGDLDTGAATVDRPSGLAVDAAAGRIDWSNAVGDAISYANLDGSGGGDLATGAASVNAPYGVAVDATAGRIYWANDNSNTISYANLDGSGGGDLDTTGAAVTQPNMPVLLRTPQSTAVPTISGGSAPGSTLACSTGSWAPDLLPSFLYRAPHRLAYRWSHNGTDIPGASASAYAATAAGEYRCTVTGANAAGGASHTSAPHTIAAPPSPPHPAPPAAPAPPTFGPRTLVTLRLAARRIPARGPVKVRVANRNRFRVTGRLAGRARSGRRGVSLRAKPIRVAALSRRAFSMRLPRPLRRSLRRTGRVRLRLTARVTDPAGRHRTVSKRVTPRLKTRRP